MMSNDLSLHGILLWMMVWGMVLVGTGLNAKQRVLTPTPESLTMVTRGGSTGYVSPYRTIFGERYKEAEQFLYKSSAEMQRALMSCGYDSLYPIIAAMVFPELVRYSLLRDKMEITALKGLYVHFGAKYANFSIGRFQMKPSFAEYIETMSGRLGSSKAGAKISAYNATSERDIRRERIARMEEIATQTIYACALYDVLVAKFSGEWSSMNAEERVRFAASAYNVGVQHTVGTIRVWQKKRFFPEGAVNPLAAYSDVAVAWWREHRSDALPAH